MLNNANCASYIKCPCGELSIRATCQSIERNSKLLLRNHIDGPANIKHH